MKLIYLTFPGDGAVAIHVAKKRLADLVVFSVKECHTLKTKRESRLSLSIGLTALATSMEPLSTANAFLTTIRYFTMLGGTKNKFR